MADKKLVVVFGATGVQGGSVVRTLLGDPKTAAKFSVRGVTRDASKPAAKDLVSLGAEVVTANLDDKAALKAAIKGAYAVFSVTNFWEIFSAEKETEQGKNVADVCKELGVQHLIWSSLLNVTKLSNGKLDKVFHFDGKAAVEDYIREIGIPATYVLAGFYNENIPGKIINEDPKADGGNTKSFTLALPIPADSPIPLIDTGADMGKFVKGILLNREKTLGKRIYAATDYYTPERMVKEFQEVTGHPIKFFQLPDDMYKGFLAQAGMPEIVQEELLQNMQLMPQFGYYGGDTLTESHSILDEPLTTWKEYVAKISAWK